MYATFEGFEIEMTKRDVSNIAHQGQNDADVAEYLKANKSIHRQFKKIGNEAVAEELKGYGSWDDEELKDIEQNKARIVWLAAWRIVEEN